MSTAVKRVVRSVYQRMPFKYPIALLARRLRAPWRLARHLQFQGVFSVEVDPSHSFRIRTSGLIEKDLFWRGYGHGWEAMSLRAWARLAPHAGTIVDIGANVGVYALAARALNPSARIIAFEPLPRMYERLMANAALNEYDLDVRRVAVSDREGVATLFDRPPSAYQKASLEQPTGGDTDYVEVPVDMVRLDAFCAANGVGPIDLMKIDIEGHEPAVLRGMGTLIRDWRPTILIEVVTGQTADDVWSMLEPVGYEAYRVFERRGLARVFELAPHQGKNRNYIVCRPGVIDKADLRPLLVD